MLDSILNHLLFYGGSLALTMALVQFAQIFRDGKRIWLFIFFSCISAIGFQQYYYGINGWASFEITRMRGQMVVFLLGPSIFFFYRKLFYRDFLFTIKDSLHFIPPALSLCVDIIMHISAPMGGETLSLVQDIIISFNTLYIISAAVIFIVYNLYILGKENVFSLFGKKMKEQINRIALTFIVMVLMIGILLLIAIIIDNLTLGRFAMTFMIIPFLYVYLIGSLNPDVFEIITSVIRKNIYERSLMKGLDVESLKGRLRDLMEEEKVYCDEDLSLKRLADMLSISPHQLSEFLNKHLNISFTYYINRYRIDEAVNLIQTQPERSITSICYSVGFNSKSAFYEAFNRFTGMSPARYRRNRR